MRHLNILFIVLSMCFVCKTEAHFIETHPETIQQIASVYHYAGDKKGNFTGDIVVVLRDGSEWKVHPTDTNRFHRWKMEQWVHAAVRTSFYWFKREHKFRLYNHDLADSVKVMLVKHASNPLIITHTHLYPTSTYLMPIFIEVAIYEYDKYGIPYIVDYDYQFSHFEEVPCNYQKDLYLSDGSIWRIKKHFNSFPIEQRIYIGVNQTDDECSFFLISGCNKDAIWSWAEAVRG